MSSSQYANLTACTLVPEANSTYLSHIGDIPYTAPTNGPIMGLMMFLSAFQYQAPYIDPTYSNAARQAGKAAYVQSGGNKMEDSAVKYGTEQVKKVGMTDAQAAILFGTAKTIRDRHIDLNGPRVYSIKTHLTLSPDSGSVGLKYEW